MLGGDAAGVTSSHQRLYMDRPAGSGSRWNQCDMGFADNGGISASRTRSYTIGSSLDPAIDALKAAMEQAAPFISGRNPYCSSSPSARNNLSANSTLGGQFDPRFSCCPDSPQELDFGGSSANDQNNVPLLLSLVSDYRALLRDYVVDFEKAAAAGVSPSSSSGDMRATQGLFLVKREGGHEAAEGANTELLYSRVARCCASWLESLSQQAFPHPSMNDGSRSQIDNLAASVPPMLAEEAISSLLKTAILQSLLLTRMAHDKFPSLQHPKKLPYNKSASGTSTAPLLPSPQQISAPPPAPSASSSSSINNGFAANKALMQALRESPSDSTITSLLQEVDLQRIAARFSSLANGRQPFPSDVGSLLRSTAAATEEKHESKIGFHSAEARNRSYSDFQQHEALPRSSFEGKKMAQPPASSLSRRLNGSGSIEPEDDFSTLESSLDAATNSKKKKNAQQRTASPNAAPSQGALEISPPIEGVHVPQLDLDAILMPGGPAIAGPNSTHAGNKDNSEWQQRVRQAVRKGTASLLTNNSRLRLRSQSDLVARPSDLDNPISEDLDLRPTWMRKPKLLQTIKSKIEMMVQQKPVFYVEWNILGFLKVLNDPTQDRIVSPEYAVSSVGSDLGLPPLRLMVSIFHGDSSEQTGSSSSGSGQESVPMNHRRSQWRNVKIGVEFTIPADIEVKYHVFHGSFLSEARWHSFKDKPWAGVNAFEVSDYLPHPIGQSLTVGAILLEIEGKGLTSPSAPKLPSSHIPSSPNLQADSNDGDIRQDRDGAASIRDDQSNLSGSPCQLMHSSSSSSRQVSFLHTQAPALNSVLQRGSGASLTSVGCYGGGGRPRAYSDWPESTHHSLTPPLPLQSQLSPLPPHMSNGPIGLPSVSDLLRLSGAPEAFLTRSHGDAQSGMNGSVVGASETPSLMLHESLSRMSLNPSSHFEKQLFADIWDASTTSPPTFDDLVSGCLR